MVPAREEKLDQLERLLRSRNLQGSENLKAFLRFVVLKTVDNQEVSLKEYTIATEVFGRSNNYDSRSDSTVRVQAGRLRTKLQEYYATEGKHDKVLIDLPKGHYTPTFSYIEGTNGAALRASAAADIITAPEPRRVRDKRSRLTTPALIILSLLLGALAVNYGLESSRLKKTLALSASAPADVQAAAPLWGDFFNSPEPVLV